jgi:hypothetical protein
MGIVPDVYVVKLQFDDAKTSGTIPRTLGAMTDSQRLTVDGEVFEVHRRADEPGTYDVSWLSGPNEGYGFSSLGHTAMDDAWLVDVIRDFLGQIDPQTGYLG